MEVVHAISAGLDVHLKTVVACVLRSAAAGTSQQTRTFGTTLPELQRLRDWLRDQGVTAVAMEATGVYWKPVYNVLEGHFTLLVANPEHIKAIPRRKTDPKDAAWIAQLLRHGLVRGSFIPDREQRELRELTRYRTALIQDRARVVNRLQKTLEAANIKLAAVLSDITGVSGERILKALLRGERDPETLAGLADDRILSRKRPALEQAVSGQLRERLRFLVNEQMGLIADLDQRIKTCDEEVARQMAPFAEVIARLDAIPGVGQRTAEILLAELGTDLSRFPTYRQLAAWAGMCPGNRSSGGKQRRSGTRKGNPWVRRALTQAAWAAGRSKQSYLGQQYRRWTARKGRKRAVVAVGHEILISIYYMLTRNAEYHDLGLHYLDKREEETRRRRAIRQLETLGYHVQLTPRPEAA
jgi:transposase